MRGRTTTRGLVAALAMVMLPVAPAAAADWLAPEVLPEVLQPETSAAAAGEGTFAAVRFLPDDTAEVVRRAPGGAVSRLALSGGDRSDPQAAASPGGTVAVLVTRLTDDGETRRVVSWAPGASEPQQTPAWESCGAPADLVLFDDAHVGVVEGGCGFGDSLVQRSGALGGALTAAPLTGPIGQGYAYGLDIASRAGRPPVLVLGIARDQGARRLAVARSTGARSFAPFTTAGDVPDPAPGRVTLVRHVRASLAADGSLGVLYTAETSFGSPSVRSLRAARIGAAGTLDDDRELQRTDAAGTTVGSFDATTGTGGRQLATWSLLTDTFTKAQTFVATRAAGTGDFTVRTPAPQPVANGARFPLGAVGDGRETASAVVFDQTTDTLAIDAYAPGPDGSLVRRSLLTQARLDVSVRPGLIRGDDAAIATLTGEGTTQLRTFDAAAPVLTIDRADPDGALAVRFTATARDASGPPAVRWRFGDGAEATGADVRHVFPAPGRYEVTAEATDLLGERTTVARTVEVAAPPTQGSSPPPAVVTPPAADRAAPVLSSVRLVPARVRRGRTAVLRFRTSEAATVRVELVRLVTGVRRGRRCVAGRPRRRAQRCEREEVVRTTSVPVAAGVRALRIATKDLPRTRLTARITATDAAGNTTRPIARRLEVRR